MPKLSFHQYDRIDEYLKCAERNMRDIIAYLREANLHKEADIIENDTDRLLAYARWIADKNQED